MSSDLPVCSVEMVLWVMAIEAVNRTWSAMSLPTCQYHG